MHVQNDPEILVCRIKEARRKARCLGDLAIWALEAQQIELAESLGRRAAAWRRKANRLSGA
jgi:hypothetical protein